MNLNFVAWWRAALRHEKAILRALPIVFLAGAFGIAFSMMLREPIASDDCSYFDAATGRNRGYINAHRMGLVFATRIFYWVFGYDAVTYYAVPFLSGLGLILVLYFIARRFAPTGVAVLAAFAFLANPDFLDTFTLLLPDVPSLFWFCTGVLLYLRALDPRTRFDHWSSPVLAGACFFLSWWTKEAAVLQFVALPVALLIAPRTRCLWRASGIVAGTAAGLVAAECLTYALTEGDLLYRYHAVSGHHVKGARNSWVRRGLVPDDYNWLDMAVRFIGSESHRRSEFYKEHQLWGINYLGLVWVGFAGGVIGWMVQRTRSLGFLFALAVVTWAAVSFAVVKLDPIVPILRNKPRYFLCVWVWLLLFAIVGLSHLFSALQRRTSKQLLLQWAGATTLVVSALALGYFARQAKLDHDRRYSGKQLALMARRMVVEMARADTPVKRIYGGSRDRVVRSIRVLVPSSLVPASEIASPEAPQNKPQVTGTMLLLPPERFSPASNDMMWAYGSPARKRQLYVAMDGDSARTFAHHGMRVFTISQPELKHRKFNSRLRLQFSADIDRPRIERAVLTIKRHRGSSQRYKVRSSVRKGRLKVDAVTPLVSPADTKAVELDIVFGQPTHLSRIHREFAFLKDKSIPRELRKSKVTRLP